MKTLKTIVTILLIMLFSCAKSDDDNPPTVEKPINITFTTIAGSTEGDEVGTANASKFRSPSSINIYGVDFYVCDTDNHRIKLLTSNNTVENNAGSGVSGDLNGDYMLSKFKYPIAITNWNEEKYIVDSGNNKIKKLINPGIISTAVGDISGELLNPRSIAFDKEGGLYICDTGHNKIKRAAFATGGGYILQTIAGNVQGDGINFNEPFGIAVDAARNVFVADSGNYKIKKINVSGEVTTFAGSTAGDVDGVGTGAKFGFIEGITIDSQGNLYVSDTGNNKIKKILPTGQVISLNSGTIGDFDGSGSTAKIKIPKGLSVTADGRTLYFADSGNHKIKKITFN